MNLVMKRFLIIISVMLFCIKSINAQENFKLHNFENFVGTWKYETEQELFIIEITEHNYIWLGKYKNHILTGFVKYIKNGVTVYDNLDDAANYIKGSEFIRFYLSLDNEKLGSSLPQTDLHVGFKDKKTINRADYSSYLKVQSLNPHRLKFHIEPDMFERDDYTIDKDGNPQKITDPELLNGFSIPEDMILEKVK